MALYIAQQRSIFIRPFLITTTNFPHYPKLLDVECNFYSSPLLGKPTTTLYGCAVAP